MPGQSKSESARECEPLSEKGAWWEIAAIAEELHRRWIRLVVERRNPMW
jgi:hypothetical protein